MAKMMILFMLILPAWYTGLLHSAETSSDAPEYTSNSEILLKAPDSYEQALRIWKTPEEINAWIAANFLYDTSRAARLSETQKGKNSWLSIYNPAEFFSIKTGMCVDLSRFGVETLRHIDPQSFPKYLMIEFDPVQIDGNTLRLHWLVSFQRAGKRYFFADSKRPGRIDGPYNEIQEFINEYAKYRGRVIVAYQELESYQKQRRTQAVKQQTTKKKP